jgi:indolepyruvate ferredoxin oxidoreductase beta subunit
VPYPRREDSRQDEPDLRESLGTVIAGVGGQGNILLSRVIGETALRAGIEVRISEAFGAAQRGGAVFSHVRLGKSYSPVIPVGMADALLALEPGEGLRQSRFLARNGIAVVNTRPIMSVEVLAGRATYPSIEWIRNLLTKLTPNLSMIDGSALAEQAGDPRTANMVMLGALESYNILPFKAHELEKTISGLVPTKMIDSNLKAFNLGRATVLNQKPNSN